MRVCHKVTTYVQPKVQDPKVRTCEERLSLTTESPTSASELVWAGGKQNPGRMRSGVSTTGRAGIAAGDSKVQFFSIRVAAGDSKVQFFSTRGNSGQY